MRLYVKKLKQLKDIEKKIRADLFLNGLGFLLLAEIYALDALYQEDIQRPSDIAAKIGKPATAFTPIVDSLERHGYIERRSNGKDRRSIFIRLTEEGKAHKEVIQSAIYKAEKKVK